MSEHDNKYLKEIIAHTRDLICVQTEKGDLLYVSDSVQGLLGYSKDEFYGKNIFDVIHEEDHTLASFLFNKAVDGKKHPPEEFRMINKSGKVLIIEALVQPIFTEEGNVLEILASYRDINERVELADKLLEKNYELEVLTNRLTQQNQQLQQFANVLTHNVRSPMGNIVALIDIYKNDPSAENAEFILNQLNKVSTRLMDTVSEFNDLMNIGNVDHKNVQRVSFKRIFEGVKASVANEIYNIGAEVTTNFSQVKVIKYPKVYLESIFQNLLTNALKYSSPQRKPRVHFETFKENGQVALTCSDNGLGIDMEKEGSRLFGFHNTFHENPDAKGVGLFITKTQIESMGGTITATSKVDEGTTFKVIF